MAWIESHTVLSRHRKVKETARALRIRPAYLIGHLHLLWHAALEQAEDGDLTRWTDEFIAESSDFPGDAPQFVQLLQDHGWLDGRLLHDWTDYAGKYLIGKYAKDNRDRLVEIWAKHGKLYGKKNPNQSPTESQQNPNQTPRTPLGEVGKDSDSSLPGGDARGGASSSHVRSVLAGVDPGNLLPALPDPPNIEATRAAIAPTPKEEFWAPLCRIFGLEPKTSADELRLYQQCHDFRLKGATPAEIERRAGNYRLHFSTAFTPKAVLSNWEVCKDAPQPKPIPGERPRKTLKAIS